MWEYKITKWDLGYHVYRTKEDNWEIKLEWLTGNSYTWNREWAKIFYTLDSAISALVIQKSRWKKIDTTSKRILKSEDKQEKKSWHEF